MFGRSIAKLLIALAVLLAAFFLYRYLFVSSASPETPGLQAASDLIGESSAAATTDEFVRLLERLQGVKLNSDLFASPAWKSLVNFQVELVPEPKGRRNPFSPIGFDFLNSVGATATSTATSTTPRR